MKIYLTRHGQTTWNKQNRVQGHLDSKLTVDGIKMCEKLREDSRTVKFDKCYSSDLPRAVESAKIITGNDEIITTKLLREIDLGDWNGMYFPDIEVKYPREYYNYFNNPREFRKNSGETLIDIQNRVEKFIDEFIKSGKEENILIVTHGITIIAFFNIIENIPIENFWTNKVIRNAKFNIIEYKDKKFEIIYKAPKNKFVNI